MITFTEYLEEAYTADMKKLIPSDKLKEIGQFLAQNNVSAQDSDFVSIPKKWKLSDLEDYEWCVFLLNNDTVAMSRFGRIEYPHRQKIDGTFKKEVKAVFGFNPEWSDEVKMRKKQWGRYENKHIKDKLDDVQTKVKKLSPTGVYQQMKKLVEGAGLKLSYAFYDGKNPRVSITSIFNTQTSTKYFYTDIEYDNRWYVNIKCQNIKPSAIEDYKKYVDYITPIVKELEKFDLTQLPDHN